MNTITDENRRWMRPTLSISNLLEEHSIISSKPGMQTIADQFKRIKKPVISNAFGETATMVDDGSLIVVTSAIDGEGKTFTAINLALAIAADLDHQVILIDGDLKQQRISQQLRISHLPGLQDILADANTTLGSSLIKSDIQYLSILAAGREHTNTSAALCSKQMDTLIEQLRVYQTDCIIIIDTPSMLDTAEAQIFTEIAGQIVYVIGAESTQERTIKKALKLLPARAAINLVLNKSTSIAHNRDY